MKKLLLAASVATFSTSALASEGTFYIRGDVGASMLPKQTLSALNVKLKSSNHFLGSVGVGYFVMDNIRSELVLANHFSAKQKYSSTSQTAKVSPTATSLSLKALLDVYDFGFGQVFLGAGIGASQVAGKLLTTGTVELSDKWKKKTKVSYILTAGAGFDVGDGVKLDVAYSYVDEGKLSKLKTTTTTNYKYSMKSHNLTGGVRVEL
ncbi:MAG: outer membrane beta-barrel protein [Rickettsiaceae bacterium]|nr:outer membrane beta-barrel protein [Rickettsiaceae bacterium]